MIPKKKLLLTEEKKIGRTSGIHKIMEKKPLSALREDVKENDFRKAKKKSKKIVLYIEIDDEITTVYDRIKHLKIKNIYIVVPKRATLFQSIVNLKILKKKAEDLEKNLYIITQDQNGLHLAKKIGLSVYDKLEGTEHPSLVSGKFFEDNDAITPLKASINTLEEKIPTRRKEKKFSISDLVSAKRKRGFSFRKWVKSLAPKRKHDKNSQKQTSGFVVPSRTVLLTLFIVSTLILLVIVYIALPGATVTLTPRSKIITADANIILVDPAEDHDNLTPLDEKTIPYHRISKKYSKDLLYYATGNESFGDAARGELTIFNLRNGAWPLVAETQFQTAEGLIFRTQKAVTVPAAQGADKPGTVTIEVIANQLDAYGQAIGERGNIGSTQFFLPNLSSSAQKDLYAKNTDPFTGGITKTQRKILKKDIGEAQQKMKEELEKAAVSELEAEINRYNERNKGSRLILLKDTRVKVFQFGEPVITLPPGLEGKMLPSFQIHGEIEVSGIAYNEEEVLSILTNSFKVDPKQHLVEVESKFSSQVSGKIDPDMKNITLTATLKGVEEFEISPNSEHGEEFIKKIKEHILNKNHDEAISYIQNLPEIATVEITSWPPWTTTLPAIQENIKIEVLRSE